MIRGFWRRAARLITSAGLVVGLLVFVGVWSFLATVVPQGPQNGTDVTGWADAHPVIGPVVRTLGLHHAFTSYVFLAFIILLGISTALCAWRRTKVALSLSRSLRGALRADARDVVERHDLEIPCAPGLSDSDVLFRASEALALHGIRAERRDGLVSAVSSPLSVWGSTVFHWALVALIVVVFAGQMLRSDGLMAVAVGETKSDEPASYVSVDAGPWRKWSATSRSIRVDSFEPVFKTGGIDRGAVPTVSVLDGRGNVVVSQRVYPNNMLHSRSLAINAPGTGLSVWLASVDASGSEASRFVQYLNFSQETSGGTVPLRPLTRSDPSGNALMKMYIMVPLERVEQGYGEWIPKDPSARVVVTDPEGKVLFDQTVRPGGDFAIPGGDTLRLLGIGWYSALSIVDDPTIPFVYATMIVAMLGLTMTLVFRQQLVVAAVSDGPGGQVLAVKLRLWRNTSTDRAEVQAELVRVLQSGERGSLS